MAKTSRPCSGLEKSFFQFFHSGDFRTQTGHYSLCGEGLCVGYDIGDAVSADYTGKFPFSGGTIIKVLYDVADDVYVDLERKLAAAIARD